LSYIAREPALILRLTAEHLQMTAAALAIAAAIALPLAIAVARRPRLAAVVTGVLGVAYTIPSLALLILLIAPIGLNRANVIVALVVYAQIILVRNTIAGLTAIDAATLEAADAMGMTRLARLRRVELPLAAPVILAGVRVAAVVCIAIATLGAKLGAGGLGQLLFDGVQQNHYAKIVAGAVAVSVLALTLNAALLALERRTTAHRRQPVDAVTA
jgi:osmoprotectant transport system permease protein